MSNMTVITDPKIEDEGTELPKRTYIPGVVLKSVCPECNTLYTRDLGYNHLSYPKTGTPIKITGYCSGCDHKWYVGHIVVNLTVTQIPNPEES